MIHSDVSVWTILHIEMAGTHSWPDAEEKIGKEVSFLKYPHRHIFVIEMHLPVKQLDREIEIFNWERKVKEYLNNKYANEYGTLEFGHQSCEMIAYELMEEFNAETVEVREDGYGGAKVSWWR